MNKLVLPGMSTVYENIARSVVQAHKKINSQNTSPTGTVSFHRSNGSKDIYGILNKDGYSVAKNVGDNVAPGRPLGISAASIGGILYVSWSGELEGGLPSDFYCVRAYLKTEDKINEIGELTSKGDLSYKSLGEGVQGTVYATAEDETCNEDGTPNHNISEKSDEISVVGSQIPIQGVDLEYALGESQTTPPKSGWSTTAPEWQEGMYVWQRTVTYTSDGASYSDPTCIQGASGEKGDAGIGVKAVVEQYYLSTSSTTQSGGSWSVDQPEWSEGKYLWTRSQVTWTDNTITTTTPVLAKAINKANENASAAQDTANKAQKITVENSSSIRKMSDQITSEVTARTKTDTMVSEVSSRLTQTADGFNASIDRLSDTDKKVNSWFGFGADSSGNPQLTMGSSSSPVVGVYTNAGLAYKARSGATLLEIDGASRSSTMPHVHADDVSIGSWQWVPTQGGTHFTLQWIGG